jgi:hypothetical protein
MQARQYFKKIKDLKIRSFGFDTHARILDLPKSEVKRLWNTATRNEFKRFPRTEHTMRPMPEISTKWKTYWKLETPNKYLIFYLTPTAPILIPNGFITDKGSIPLFFQNIISNYDRELLFAFFVHDVECEMQRLTRFTTDGMIYEVGTEMKANWLRKNIVYTVVRAGNRYGKKDSIVRGFNVSKYNRELIAAAETEFIKSNEFKKHLDFVGV